MYLRLPFLTHLAMLFFSFVCVLPPTAQGHEFSHKRRDELSIHRRTLLDELFWELEVDIFFDALKNLDLDGT